VADGTSTNLAGTDLGPGGLGDDDVGERGLDERRMYDARKALKGTLAWKIFSLQTKCLLRR
jgi:hypothetical protein